MIFIGDSHVGLKRNLNEDFYLIDESVKLALVCDGMGGHEMGDFASQSVATAVVDLFARLTETDMIELDTQFDNDLQPVIKRIFYAVQLANLRLLHIAEENRVKKGTGTTLVGVHIFRDSAIVFHVGDSRCYRLRNDQFECLTKDHSFAQNLYDQGEISYDEFKNFDKKNVITRAMGMSSNLKVDIARYPLQQDDIFLLCTDGLWGLVEDSILQAHITENLDHFNCIPNVLIDAANAVGGDDNITSLLVQYDHSVSKQDDIEPASYSLSLDVSDIPAYETVLKRYYTKKKFLKNPYILASVGLFLVLILSLIVIQSKSPGSEPDMYHENGGSVSVEEVRIPDQTVYFYLDSNSKTEWRNAEVTINSQPMGLLSELENGFRIQPGTYKFFIILGNDTVHQDEFECIIDPTGERNLIEIQSE